MPASIWVIGESIGAIHGAGLSASAAAYCLWTWQRELCRAGYSTSTAESGADGKCKQVGQALTRMANLLQNHVVCVLMYQHASCPVGMPADVSNCGGFGLKPHIQSVVCNRSRDPLHSWCGCAFRQVHCVCGWAKRSITGRSGVRGPALAFSRIYAGNIFQQYQYAGS